MKQDLIYKSKCKESFVYSRCNSCNTFFGVPVRCKSVLCVECQEIIGRSISKRLENLFLPRLNKYFLTLTLPNTPGINKDLLKNYRKWVRLFFNYYNRQVNRFMLKGFYVFEFKKNCDYWNPHIHIVYEGFGIDKQDLSNVWLGIHKDKSARVVDVKRLRNNPVKALEYCSKYLSKVPKIENEDEYLEVMKGFKRYGFFGTKKGEIKTPEKKGVGCPFCDEGKLEFSWVVGETWFNLNDKKMIFLEKKRRLEIGNRMSLFFNVDTLEHGKEYSYLDLIEKGFNDFFIDKCLREGDLYEPKVGRYSRI